MITGPNHNSEAPQLKMSLVDWSHPAFICLWCKNSFIWFLSSSLTVIFAASTTRRLFPNINILVLHGCLLTLTLQQICLCSLAAAAETTCRAPCYVAVLYNLANATEYETNMQVFELMTLGLIVTEKTNVDQLTCNGSLGLSCYCADADNCPALFVLHHKLSSEPLHMFLCMTGRLS